MLVFGGVKFIKPVGNLLVSCTIPMVQMKLFLNRQHMGVAWSEMSADCVNSMNSGHSLTKYI